MRFKKIQTMALVISVVGLLVLVGASRLCAESTYVGSIHTPFLEQVGEEFVTGNNTIHIRDRIYSFVVDGELDGTGTFSFNYESNMSSGIDVIRGSLLFDITGGGLTGNFECRLVGKVTSGLLSAMFVGSGVGEFEGHHIKGTLEGYFDTFEFVYIAEIYFRGESI